MAVAASVLIFLIMVFSPSIPDAEGASFTEEIDGINYILDDSAFTATVTAGTEEYSGNIEIPSTVLYDGDTYSVTSIDDTAFKKSQTTSIIIGKNVTSIGSALSGCASLTSISVDSENASFSSADGVLYNKTGLNLIQYPGGKTGSFTIPSTVKTTSNYAFASSTELTSVIIPDSVTSLGTNVFKDCTKLTTVIFDGTSALKTLPASIFENCSGLESITIPYSVTKIDGSAFKNCSSLDSIIIPNQVTSIGGSAFRDCTSLESIIIPVLVSSMSINTFDGCSNLESVEFKGTLITAIGSKVFFNCSSLASITLPESVATIDTSAFSGCTNLKSVSIPGVTAINGSAFRYCSSLTSLTIPDTVTTIGNNAFEGSGLISIVIPASVKSIGSQSFKGCLNLNSVIFNGPSLLTTISNESFLDCSSLTSITIPNSVKTIGSSAFTGCAEMESVIFEAPSILEKIDESFKNCSKLESIVIPNTVTEITSQTFSGCKGLTTVTFEGPSALDAISVGLFYGCSGLKTINIPSSVETIGGHAFNGCSNLKTLTFDAPSSLTSIGNNAFIGCKSLESVSFPSTLKTIDASAFSGCSSLASVTIPNSVTSIGSSAFSSAPVRTLTITYSADGPTSAALGTSFAWKLTAQSGEVTDLIIDASDLSVPSISGKTGKTIVFKENATATTGGLFYDPDGPVLMEGDERAGKIYYYDTTSGKWLTFKYTVSFESNGGTSVSDKRVYLDYNLTEPDDPERYGYVFEGWFTDSDLTTAYDFSTPVTSDFTLYAKWSPAFLSTITPSAGPEGWIDPSTPQDVPYDGITFSFGANDGYRIKDVRVNGISVPYDAESDVLGTYVFRYVEHDSYTIHVEFEPYFTVSVNDLDNGSVEISNSKPIPGDSVTITIRSDVGYTLNAFTDNGIDVLGSVNMESEGVWTYVLSSVISDHDIQVTLVKITYVMAVDFTGEGTVDPSDGFIVEHGDDLTFTFKAAEGYHIKEVFADGISVSYNVSTNGVGTYSFLNVVEIHTFEIIFELNTYNVVLKQGTGYSLTAAEGSSSPVYHRESFGIVFSLNEGYDQSRAVILVNGSMIAIIDGKHDVTIVVTSIVEDIKITVENVVLNSYTVTADLNGGFFDTDPDGWTEEADGSYTKNFNHYTSYSTIINDLGLPEKTGYEFDRFTPSEGTLVATGVSFTAQWTVNTYTITFDSDGGSAVGSITQDYGTSITVPVNPTKEGNTFTGWSPEVPAIMPAENITVTATWDINQYVVTVSSNEVTKFSHIIDGNDPVNFTAGPDNPYSISVLHGSILIIEAMPDEEGGFRWVNTGTGTVDGNILTIDMTGNENVSGYPHKQTEVTSFVLYPVILLSIIPLFIGIRRLRL